ncbi:MAG: urease accessory protein UreF, partial [Prochlorococcus sp.]|nr:urease accessory protein UreF [Prochlorococcus sp.]MDP6193387.1 urease accessory UreF family protein [Prochlorococcaceae cyanobacterium ETNP18_MAG_1]
MTSLALLQLVSPALPVGAFSYSEGLEWLVQNGQLHDAASVSAWLEAELCRGQMRMEAAALIPLRLALSRWSASDDADALSDLQDLDGWLLALREAPELRAQQRQMGQSLLQLLVDLGHPLPAPAVLLHWPAAWAWASHAWQVSELDMLNGYLYSWVANQLSAAVRLVPLGPTKAQLLLQSLLPLVSAQAKALIDQDPKSLWSGGVGSSMAQLSHDELYSRLFRT